MKSQKINVRQVDGGEWQASYEGGIPNDFQTGKTEEEARQNLIKNSIETAAKPQTVNAPITVTDSVTVAVDRIIIKRLPNPTEIDGKICTHAAWRESDPSIQGYGENETAAKVKFLTGESAARK